MLLVVVVLFVLAVLLVTVSILVGGDPVEMTTPLTTPSLVGRDILADSKEGVAPVLRLSVNNCLTAPDRWTGGEESVTIATEADTTGLVGFRS